MTLTTLAWLGMAAYALHIMEEFSFNWRDWARNVLGLPVEWSDFYVTNGIVVALGVAQAMLAPTLPLAALSFSSLMLINALLFHVAPVLRSGGRFSSGLFTAVMLFLPLSTYTLWTAWASVGGAQIVLGLAIGALVMAYPVVMLKLRSRPYFRQDR